MTIRKCRPLAWSLAVVVTAASAESAAASLTIVENGRPVARLVTADEASKSARDAARALQSTIERMSGATLPIVPESKADPKDVLVLVGPSRMAAQAGVTVAQHPQEPDGYRIVADDRRVVLLGNDAGRLRGTAYAAYDLLQRLGCGWYGPAPAWQVVPKRATVTIPPLQIREQPAFVSRDIWAIGRLDQSIQDAWRIGGHEVDHGHAFDRWLPRDKLAAEHPDWFSKDQPCLTHPGVIAYVSARLRERIDGEKDPRVVVASSLSANDSEHFCECDRCRAVGNVSTRSLQFVNAIARNLATTHPNRYLLTFYAYWATHDPPEPMLQAEPGVCVMQVNEGNHMRPWDHVEPEAKRSLDANDNNFRELIAFDGWRRTGAILGIYEWWIPCDGRPIWCRVPWYSGETTLRNLRYWYAAGVRYLSYQSGGEKTELFPRRWPLYYIGARGMWDPAITCERIMAEACDKLYGPAARPMQRYYETLELAMARAPEKLRGYAWKLRSPEDIYTPEVEAAATAALDEAHKMELADAIRERVRQERAVWDEARQAIAKERAASEKPQTRPDQQYK